MTDSSADNLGKARIHQLLAAVGSAQTEADSVPEAVAYNWRDPRYFNASQCEQLSVAMAEVATSLAQKLVHFFGGQFEVTPGSFVQHYANDLAGHVETDNSFILSFGPDANTPIGFLTVPAETALAWVTRLLGDTQADNSPGRTLSSLEASLLLDLMTAMTDCLLDALREHHTFNACGEVSRSSVTVAFEPTQEIAVIGFEIKNNDAEANHRITFALPCSPMAPLVGKSVEAAAKSPAKDMSNVLREHLCAMPVTISVRLASATLRFDEALDINQGDILLLDKSIDEAIDLIVENRTILRGRPAKSDGRYAVCVTERVAESVAEPAKRPAAK